MGVYLLEDLSSWYIKINFDGNIRNRRDGTSFVIREPNLELVMVEGSYLFESMVYVAEFRSV